MAGARKDNKGRVLLKGESYRKIDFNHKCNIVYDD